MSSLFNKAYNKYVDVSNKMNHKINDAVGKEIIGDMRKIEDPKDFPDYSTFPPYEKEKPENLEPKQFEQKIFDLCGYKISLDEYSNGCIKYRSEIMKHAEYYRDLFIYKYNLCATDYDSFVHYFGYMYKEVMTPMLHTAYGILLSFGIFDINEGYFIKRHTAVYKRGPEAYNSVIGIQNKINENAQAIGDTAANLVKLQGGGFGVKNALKGIAKAEAFNTGMDLIGKHLEIQCSITPEQKQAIYDGIKKDILFNNIYYDLCNVYFTLLHILKEKKYIKDIKIDRDDYYNTTLKNLDNPMFPQDKKQQTIISLIGTYPFVIDSYPIAEKIIGESQELAEIRKYIIG